MILMIALETKLDVFTDIGVNKKGEFMKRYAVIREYEPGDFQVTFNEHEGMFHENQMHVEESKNEMSTIKKFEKKYKIKLEWREAKKKTHYGWFIKK